MRAPIYYPLYISLEMSSVLGRCSSPRAWDKKYADKLICRLSFSKCGLSTRGKNTYVHLRRPFPEDAVFVNGDHKEEKNTAMQIK